MSSYNMLERIPKGDPRGLLPREPSMPAYSYSRSDVDVSDSSLWRQGWLTIRKHWKAVIVFVAVLEFALGLLALSMPNTYEARAVLDVEPPAGDTIVGGQDPTGVAGTAAYLDTQTEILQGDGLALSVIDQLHLDQNPEFMRQTPMERSISWVTGLFRSGKGEGQADIDRLLGIFHGGFGVGQIKGSQLVEVHYESGDPKLAAQIVNATVNQYLDRTYRSRYEATLRAAQSLSPQLADLQQSMTQSSNALLNFQRSHEGAELGAASSVSSDGTTNAGSAGAGNPLAVRASELNQQLTQAMGERLQQESYLKQIQSGKIDDLPQMKDSALIQGLTTRLVDSRAQLAQALGIYGTNNPEVKKLQSESDELTKELETERGRIANQIQAAYASAQNRELLIRDTLRGMKGELDRSNADVVQYDTLKRAADADANLYTTLSSKTRELAVSGSLSSSNIRILDEARAPLSPNGPHRFRILGVGAMFGLFGGVILAFAAEGMDDTIGSADDLWRCSGLPALALVPHITVGNGKKLGLVASKSSKALVAKSMATVRTNGLKFLTEKPQSAEAEAIRNLETAIRIPDPSTGRSVQIVLVTSALPGEGKTTVATNLALALARHGTTCLIDADLRHPSITPSFNLSQRSGLQDLLASRINSMQDVMKPLAEIPNLTVIGAGNRLPNALEVIASARMSSLISELRKQFDFIVLDTPPIIPFAEARWLSTLSDASILIARCGVTSRGAALRSLEILEDLKSNILGVVLNGVDLNAEYYSYGMKDYSSYASHLS